MAVYLEINLCSNKTRLNWTWHEMSHGCHWPMYDSHTTQPDACEDIATFNISPCVCVVWRPVKCGIGRGQTEWGESVFSTSFCVVNHWDIIARWQKDPTKPDKVISVFFCSCPSLVGIHSSGTLCLVLLVWVILSCFGGFCLFPEDLMLKSLGQ